MFPAGNTQHNTQKGPRPGGGKEHCPLPITQTTHQTPRWRNRTAPDDQTPIPSTQRRRRDSRTPGDISKVSDVSGLTLVKIFTRVGLCALQHAADPYFSSVEPLSAQRVFKKWPNREMGKGGGETLCRTK